MTQRLARGLDVGFQLCFVALLLALFPFLRSGEHSVVGWVLFVTPPVVASGVFGLASVLVPDLVVEPGWDRASALLWPLAYGALLHLVSRFLTTSPNPLFALMDEFNGAVFWREPLVGLGVLTIQAAIFSVLVAIRPARTRRP